MQQAQITELLELAETGDSGAIDRVMELLYADMRRRAGACIRREFGPAGSALTLQPTALVNEAYLKLLRQKTPFANRQHFLAIATRVMFRVLIDYRRARGAEKRGGDLLRVTLTDLGDKSAGHEADVVDLAAALERLDALDQRKAEVVKLRALWGLEMTEIADTLGVSLTTVERDWRFARSWLAKELDEA